MVGENIKRLRMEHHMTQKELADRLFVTAQAVSRWEKGDVEPSLRTIAELAKIFGVPSDVLLGIEEAEAPTAQKKNFDTHEQDAFFSDKADKEAPHHQYSQNGYVPQMLALCEKCNRPIYESDEIVRIRKKNHSEIRCRECHLRIEKTIEWKLEQQHEEHTQKCIKKAKKARIKCIVLGAILLALFLYAFIYNMMDTYASEAATFIWEQFLALAFYYCIFSIVSCCWFRNNFLGKMLVTLTFFLYDILSEIFDFDDFVFWVIFGIFYLIALIIGAIIALIAGIAVAPFLFPFALRKNLKHPEATMLEGFWTGDN